MKTRSNIPKGNETKVDPVTGKSQQTAKQASQLKDNRSVTIAQKRTQAMADSSSQVQQTAQLQEMADQYTETLPAIAPGKRAKQVTQLKIVQGKQSRTSETIAREIKTGIIQRKVSQQDENGGGPPAGKESWWYSDVTKEWYPVKALAERAEKRFLEQSAKASASDGKKKEQTKTDESASSVGAAAAASAGKVAAPVISAQEKLKRAQISEMIAKEIAEEFVLSQPGIGRKAATPAFSNIMRKKFKIKGAKPNPVEVEAATNPFSLDEIMATYQFAQQRKANWSQKDRFNEHAGPYKTFSPAREHFYDQVYIEAEHEVDTWHAFLNRDIVLGKKSEIDGIKQIIAGIQKDLARGGPKIGHLLDRVALNSTLTAERMKLSNTVAGAGNQAKLDAGQGIEVAKSTPEGKQWHHADQFMMKHVAAAGNIGELPQVKPELTPEFIMQINSSESSEKGLVNSQASGELRYSAIPLGSKVGAYNLRLVPPSRIAISLAGLVNGINEQLTHIKKPEDIWEIIPIAARFYTDFIAIHPFPDGNGRTARKVVDFLLLSYGLPPAQFDNATKNFGAGIPDVQGPLKLERQHTDLEGVMHVLTAVRKSFETLMSAK